MRASYTNDVLVLPASRFLARDCRLRPPRHGDNAVALPPASQDTGNRISFTGLRAFARNARFRFSAGSARNRACNPFHSDAVSM